MQFPILTFITFLPILGMLAILFIPGKQEKFIKWFSIILTGIQVIFAVIILNNYNYSLGGIFDQNSFQFIEKFRWIEISGISWIGTIKIDYFLGIDGISAPMVLLTALISFIAAISSSAW